MRSRCAFDGADLASGACEACGRVYVNTFEDPDWDRSDYEDRSEDDPFVDRMGGLDEEAPSG